ncbi:MAG: ABC transporter substrate-binding protein [Burkholderiales bacterium]
MTALACAAALQTSAFAQETIKIGFVHMEAGPFAGLSKFMVDAGTFGVEALNAQGGALGRKYELVMQSHAGTPAAAVAAVRRLIEQQGASFVTGLQVSSTGLAVAAKMPQLNGLLIDPSTASDALSGKNCTANYFRVSMNDTMIMNANRSIVKQSGVKAWDVLAADYAAGHDYAEKFIALIKELGGSSQATLFAPLSTTDFGSYISQLGNKPADGLLVMYPGSGAIALAKQQQQFGLFAKYKNVITAYFTNDAMIDAQGDSTLGLLTLQDYQWELPGAQNAAYVKAFEARYRRKPTFLDGNIQVSLEMLHAAILKARSTDVAAVRTALAGLKATTVAGEVELRAADHQAIRPMSLLKVVKAGDGKAMMKMQDVVPAAAVTFPPSPECKL